MYEYLLEKYEKHKILFGFILGFLSTSFAILLNISSKNPCASYTILLLSIIPMVPVLTKIIEYVEEHEERGDQNLLLRYIDYIKFYFSLFFGVSLSFYFWFIITGNPVLFLEQIIAIKEIHQAVTGSFYLENTKFFYLILTNNFKVLILSFILSFIFGAGAVYVTTWNASILGVFLGLEALEYKGNFVAKYVAYPLYKLARILPHGIFEFSAFFLAALAGNSLGIIMIKGYGFKDEKFHRVLADAVLLFFISIMLLVLAAFIEAYL